MTPSDLPSAGLPSADLASTEAAKLEHEAYGWVVRFVSGLASQDDLAALREWSARSPAHAAAFDQASRVWQACAPLGQMQSQRQGQHQGRRQGQRQVLAQAQPRFSRPAASMGRRAFLGGAVAATAATVVLLVDPPLGLWPSWSELSADYRTETGEQRQITLAEDVSVSLNTQTSIALRRTAGAVDRIELVAGEAMVSTQPQTSRLFTVVAANGQIAAAADARFNLRCGDGSVCVTCLQGEVRVLCGAAELPLPAGRQVIYTARGIEPAIAADLAMVTAWRDGIVIFDATPLTEVIGEINRYRPGRIILANAALSRERFSARFRIANIDRVLGEIEQVFGARVTTLPGGIVLLG